MPDSVARKVSGARGDFAIVVLYRSHHLFLRETFNVEYRTGSQNSTTAVGLSSVNSCQVQLILGSTGRSPDYSSSDTLRIPHSLPGLLARVTSFLRGCSRCMPFELWTVSWPSYRPSGRPSEVRAHTNPFRSLCRRLLLLFILCH